MTNSVANALQQGAEATEEKEDQEVRPISVFSLPAPEGGQSGRANAPEPEIHCQCARDITNKPKLSSKYYKLSKWKVWNS